MEIPSSVSCCIPKSAVSGRLTSSAIRRCNSSRFIHEPHFFCLQGFGVNFGEGRDVVIPLKQSGSLPYPLNGTRIQLPDWVENRMVVSIKGVLFKLRVTGNVNLRDP